MPTPEQPFIILTPNQLQDCIKQAVKEVLGPILDKEEREFLTHKEVRELTGHTSPKLSNLVQSGVLRRGGGRGNYRYVAKDVYSYLSGEAAIKPGQRIQSKPEKPVTRLPRSSARVFR